MFLLRHNFAQRFTYMTIKSYVCNWTVPSTRHCHNIISKHFTYHKKLHVCIITLTITPEYNSILPIGNVTQISINLALCVWRHIFRHEACNNNRVHLMWSRMVLGSQRPTHYRELEWDKYSSLYLMKGWGRRRGVSHSELQELCYFMSGIPHFTKESTYCHSSWLTTWHQLI